MALNHENLKVYQRALAFNASVPSWIEAWDARHTIRDHLPRAAESVLENIAMASAAYSAMKVRSLNYAIGSTLECAACLDLADVKGILPPEVVRTGKEGLAHILRMLVGLRRSWLRPAVAEGPERYGEGLGPPWDDTSHADIGEGETQHRVLFHHEELDAYRVSLDIATLLSGSESVQVLSAVQFRKLDGLSTSIVLNIAEGNGRFSDSEQRRFLATSHEAAVKLAARLDLCVARGALKIAEATDLKDLLLRVSAMTASMIGRLQALDTR
jgi:four helix bundle protein